MSAGATVAVGETHGRWTVIGRTTFWRWLVRCECGVVRAAHAKKVRAGRGCGACSMVLRKPKSRGLVVLRHVPREGWLVRCRRCGVERISRHRGGIEVNRHGCVVCAGVALEDMTGRTFGCMTVTGRAPQAHPDQFAARWNTTSSCCGRSWVVAGQQLREHPQEKCRDCRKAPDEVRVCRWCERSTVGRSVIRECNACERRALRNGRADDGRPLFRQHPYATSPAKLREVGS